MLVYVDFFYIYFMINLVVFFIVENIRKFVRREYVFFIFFFLGENLFVNFSLKIVN